MQNIRRKLLSQNFLHNQKLVSQLIGSSSIGKKDLVIEIGPGKGILTKELLAHAGHVIAVELDSYWYKELQKLGMNNLTLYNSDFLSYSLPKLPYKVFANIPFAIEGKIIRKLLSDPNPPMDCYLVIMNELAHRLAAHRTENMFSLMHKPWFDFSIDHTFNATDFSPPPRVTPVLFHFKRKGIFVLPLKERVRYQNFVMRGFGNGQSVRNGLKTLYPPMRINEALQSLSIGQKKKPTHLSLSQWIALYRRLCLSQ